MALRKHSIPLLHATELSEHIRMDGTLSLSNPLLMKGPFSGAIHSTSHITLDREAHAVSCVVAARTFTIAGTFSGSARAEVFIEVKDGASVNAELEAPDVAISEAARFEGVIAMPKFGD